jgi:hypothetical protein
MKNFINWIKNNREKVIRISYIIPILIAAGISVYHVVAWYGIMNPIAWAIYLSIGIEIAALSALAGMTTKMTKFVYFPFFIVTLIQLIGNIFATFEYIDVTSSTFKDWVLLVEPIFSSMNLVEEGDILGHRRFLAILGGSFIPLISLSFLHMLVSFNDKTLENTETKEESDSKVYDNIVSEEIVEQNLKEEEVETVEIEEKIKKKIENIDSEESFEQFVEKKKRKLEEDKKIFTPLLELFYKNGEIKSGDVMPTYLEFRGLAIEIFTDDNIKLFLTLCNYLKITELSDNIRKSKVDFEQAKKIMNEYLSLEKDISNKEITHSEKDNKEKSVITTSVNNSKKEWWLKK